MPRKHKLATDADMAAVEFKPFPRKARAALTHLATWEGISNPHLVNMRFAAETLGRTKPALVKLAKTLWDKPVEGKDDANLLTELVEGLQETIVKLHAVVGFLETAEVRLMCALAAVSETADEQESRQ